MKPTIVVNSETGKVLDPKGMTKRDRIYFYWALSQSFFTRDVVCTLLWEKYQGKKVKRKCHPNWMDL